jgi:hypothetical protein
MRNEKLAAALEALPEKKLISAGKMRDGDCYCALGAMLIHAGHQAQGGPYGAGITLKISTDLCEDIAAKNDDFKGTVEERYDYMLEWSKG